VIDLCGNLDVWTTDDTSRFDSEEAINPATCSNRPIVNGCEDFHQMQRAVKRR